MGAAYVGHELHHANQVYGTFALVLGDAPGASKLKKAEELGIPIVPADAFDSLLESGALPE